MTAWHKQLSLHLLRLDKWQKQWYYIKRVPKHQAQRINVLISVKCFAHMFPNTHSWYHSMSARPEEAVSRRCQYPRWPCSLPPTIAHMALKDCPPEQRSGGFLWRTGNQTFLLQWGEWPAGSISKHFKQFSIQTHCSWTKLDHRTPMGLFGDAACSRCYGILREFLLLSALFVPVLPEKWSTWRPLGAETSS